MLKKAFLIIFSLIFAFALIACESTDNSESQSTVTENESTVLEPEKTEAELIAENPLFEQAISADQSFTYNQITFKVTNVFVNFSFNEDKPDKTIKVYVDYPYEVKTVEYKHFSVIDPSGAEYDSLLLDGLDFMGQYRQEGEAGSATFIVPKKYDNFLLKVQMGEEAPIYVWFNLNNY